MRAAQRSVRRSRRSSTRWFTMCPRKCGPSNANSRRAASARSTKAPFFVATSRARGPLAGSAARWRRVSVIAIASHSARGGASRPCSHDARGARKDTRVARPRARMFARARAWPGPQASSRRRSPSCSASSPPATISSARGSPASAASRSAAPRWPPPARPSSRSTRCTSTSCAPCRRPSPRCCASRACATAAASRTAAWRCATASASAAS